MCGKLLKMGMHESAYMNEVNVVLAVVCAVHIEL
jgi:hypothetical protein